MCEIQILVHISELCVWLMATLSTLTPTRKRGSLRTDLLGTKNAAIPHNTTACLDWLTLRSLNTRKLKLTRAIGDVLTPVQI